MNSALKKGICEASPIGAMDVSRAGMKAVDGVKTGDGMKAEAGEKIKATTSPHRTLVR